MCEKLYDGSCSIQFSDKETEYTMSLGDIKELSLIIDTDDQRFGGQGVPDKAVTVKNGKAVVLLPPFSGRLYALEYGKEVYWEAESKVG
ncbi:MAG: hypothetical protein K6C13_05355 [Oscillospiraceae bacterium]|nr:hypothetical protein [Oscillospiraceae bacterium]